MYSTLLMFTMTYWTWGQFFKWTGLTYAIYYTILISYEIWKSYKKDSNTEGVGETIYEIPPFDTVSTNNPIDIKPKKVTLLDMQAVADNMIESDNLGKGYNQNMEQTKVQAEIQEPAEQNQDIVEEHSVSASQFVQIHRANIGKAQNAFS
jgi:hypothetical protein